jgi:predicted lipoprotein with Yx(FWY)xxD motif
MKKSAIKKVHQNVTRSRRSCLGAVAITASVVVLAPMLSASGATAPVMKSANVSGFPGALVNHSSRSLYILSAEKGAKLKCKADCLATWPPLLVKTSVKTVALGANVKGKIGFVARSSTMKQVTFNSYPVYTYQGDTGTLQSNGEGITADGGTWTLVKAKASSPSSTPFAASSSSTTTTAGGGYNY